MLISRNGRDLLETVGLVLPSAVQLKPHLDATENHFLAALEVNTQLHDIAIIDGKGLALLRRRAEADVVEKGAGGALDVLDVPLAVFVPKFAMATAHDLALKADIGSRGLVAGDAGERRRVALRVATDANDLGAAGQGAGDGGKGEGRAGGALVKVRGETNRWCCLGGRGGTSSAGRVGGGCSHSGSVVVGGSRGWLRLLLGLRLCCRLGDGVGGRWLAGGPLGGRADEAQTVRVGRGGRRVGQGAWRVGGGPGETSRLPRGGGGGSAVVGAGVGGVAGENVVVCVIAQVAEASQARGARG